MFAITEKESSPWNHIKLPGGLTICWGAITITTGAGSAYLNGYLHSSITTITFPDGIFTKTPRIFPQVRDGYVGMPVGFASALPSGFNPYIYNGNSGATDVSMDIIAIGK
jgi:hypothetical protein